LDVVSAIKIIAIIILKIKEVGALSKFMKIQVQILYLAILNLAKNCANLCWFV
jgi:hypothetical protein